MQLVVTRASKAKAGGQEVHGRGTTMLSGSFWIQWLRLSFDALSDMPAERRKGGKAVVRRESAYTQEYEPYKQESEDELSFLPSAVGFVGVHTSRLSATDDAGEKGSSAGKSQRRWWKITASCARQTRAGTVATRGLKRGMSWR